MPVDIICTCSLVTVPCGLFMALAASPRPVLAPKRDSGKVWGRLVI